MNSSSIFPGCARMYVAWARWLVVSLSSCGRIREMASARKRSRISCVAEVRTMRLESSSFDDQTVEVELGEVRKRGDGDGFVGCAVVNDAPDAAARAVALGMVERNLVVADDAVVKVGDVKCSVGTKLQIDRAEPGVVATEEVGLLDGRRRRAGPFELVVVDAMSDRVADKKRVAVFRREMVGGVVDDAREAGRAVRVASSSRGRSRDRRVACQSCRSRRRE